MWTEYDERKFMNTFEVVRKQLSEHSQMCSDLFDPLFDRAVVYNCPHGKKLRGVAIVEAYKIFMETHNRPVSEEEIEQSRILGWVMQLFQGATIIADDLIDRAETRRNQICWHRIVRLLLISFLEYFRFQEPKYAPKHLACMLSSVYYVLKLNFKHHSQYLNLVETFLDLEHYGLIGQNLDATCELSRRPDAIELHTPSRYETNCKYKCGYYTVMVPVKLALYLANIDDPKTHRAAENITFRTSVFLQAQDDFLDVFGKTEVIGKIGTDIQDGKCTWLSVEAMLRMNDRQKQIFKENYGKKDDKAIQTIKNIYDELNFKTVSQEYETTEYNVILKEIQEMDSIPQVKKVMLSILAHWYRRKR